MDIYGAKKIGELLCGNTYPGRGIIAGTSADGKYAVAAYFIMGRSRNSRNRVFVKKDGGIFTEPYDPSAVVDPSLIIYAAVRQYGSRLIVTNGDQTDTVYEGLASGMSFEQALESRSFEPDAPNFTPRISGILDCSDGKYSYRLSILKSADAAGSACVRYSFAYPSVTGLGHFIHTYVGDGSPLPSFQGEPERIVIDGVCPNCFAEEVWDALDPDNRISLYVRFTDISGGTYRDRIINRFN